MKLYEKNAAELSEMLRSKNPELVQIPERKKKHAVSPR